MKLAIPDMISNSYFPAIAAIELSCFKLEGLDIVLELIYPVDKCYAALRDGTVDFVGGSAHSALSAFPRWQGAKLLCAQGQGMYWFLVMHKVLGGKRGDLGVVKGHSIGAAPWVDMGLRRLLIEAGIDLVRDQVKIAPVPGAQGAGVNFGVTAAKALEERKIDGFWANGMGTEVAVRRGVGTVVLDVRRGDGPKPCFNYLAAVYGAILLMLVLIITLHQNRHCKQPHRARLLSCHDRGPAQLTGRLVWFLVAGAKVISQCHMSILSDTPQLSPSSAAST